ncbi:SIR2 family protein [Psychrobacter pocilloporae]|uniref:SIR2 family protein n=1 Tax=Psychrobacter pocilloporae TaxID=1775882 RepID=UPI003C2EFEEF
MSNYPNIIKVRDDHEPTFFGVTSITEDEPDNKNSKEMKFTSDPNSNPAWLNGSESFSHWDLRSRIEPWLTALFQSEHLSLLAGAGITHAVHYIAANKPAAGMSQLNLNTYGEEINKAAKESSEASGRKEGNIEDQLRVANELFTGLEILNDSKASDLKEELERGLQKFADAILESEKGIATAQEHERELAFNTLVTFLMSFASRTGVRDRLNIFTTNYDRLIETGAEIAGLHLIDRFIGNISPIFRSSRLDIDMHYNPPGIRGEPRYLEGVVRFSKLHGSIDWLQYGNDIRRLGLPFGASSITPYLDVAGYSDVTAHEMMIYPNAAKDQETANYPYVELFRDLASAICRPNSTLVTYGYSFGDEHINRVIRDMLTIPSTHLVIISYDDPLGKIMKLYDEWGRHSQISLLIGPELADITNLTQYYLPKAAIDKTTSRMSDLLKQRMTSSNGTKPINEADSDGPDLEEL